MTRTVHGRAGLGTCPRLSGGRCTPSTCPAVQAEVMELWLDAPTQSEAILRAARRYPQPPMRVMRGLSERTKSYLDSRKAHLMGRGHPTKPRARTQALAGSDRMELARG